MVTIGDNVCIHISEVIKIVMYLSPAILNSLITFSHYYYAYNPLFNIDRNTEIKDKKNKNINVFQNCQIFVKYNLIFNVISMSITTSISYFFVTFEILI